MLLDVRMRAIMQVCARASAWALCLCVISARACVHVRVRVLYMCGQLYMFVRVCACMCTYVQVYGCGACSRSTVPVPMHASVLGDMHCLPLPFAPCLMCCCCRRCHILQVDAGALSDAHYLLRPFCLRRIKDEVEVALPPKVETRIAVPLSDQQTFWYRRWVRGPASIGKV